MKTLENQTLLYDEDCPMCKLYTAGFIRAGMLDKNGKKPFSAISAEEDFIDLKRASNEIVLIDNQNKTAIYGIDSLLKVIGNSFPWIEKAGNFTPIKYLLKKLYSFISYNRKVIIPSRTDGNVRQCVPDFNYRYRFFYIIFAASASASIFSKLNFPTSEIFIFNLGLVIFQSLFILKYDAEKILNYAGNLMTVLLFGSLILIPVFVLNILIKVPGVLVQIWFLIGFLIMLAEHLRRLRLLQLPLYLAATWTVYAAIIIHFLNS
ncbi:hypothetical protein [Flavobacterium sp. 3HN19-14]|uniref:hypothetical protein n=1 Tax=Flavobacterium sp. 3HN19-14 TaxID=3448133 RepID=UPI003EE01016